jgi:hypothetical protein
MALGCLLVRSLSGVALDFFTTGTGSASGASLDEFLDVSSSIGALVLFVAIALFFAGGSLIRSKEPDLVEALV